MKSLGRAGRGRKPLSLSLSSPRRSPPFPPQSDQAGDSYDPLFWPNVTFFSLNISNNWAKFANFREFFIL